jgi:hypothetical protein
MITKGTAFAKYSSTLSWIVSAISLILALLSYLGEGNNPAVTALLWLGVAVAFAISGSALGGILVTQLVVLRVSN